MLRALLLDIGGVVIRTPFELLQVAEDAHGLPDGALGPRGPFALDEDQEFVQVLDGTLPERDYWQRRAERAAPYLDIEPDTRSLIDVLYDRPEDELVRPEVRRLVRDARAAAVPVGGLTNDLSDFHGQAWVDRMTIFAELDVVVDGSRTGVLKPDPRAFELAVEAMGLPASELVLLDDQPVNTAGAEAAGIRAVRLDPVQPEEAVATVRSLLDLPAADRTTPVDTDIGGAA